MSAEKRSVSAPRDLFQRADARLRLLGYANFSQYVQALMRADVLTAGDHTRAVVDPDAMHDRPNSSPGHQAAKEIVDAHAAAARAATSAPPPPKTPVTYKAPRKSKKPPPA